MIDFLVKAIRKINIKIQNHTAEIEKIAKRLKQVKDDETSRFNSMKNLFK